MSAMSELHALILEAGKDPETVDLSSDYAAGYWDARRTPSPRMLDGLSWGGLTYAAGYARGTIASRRKA